MQTKMKQFVVFSSMIFLTFLSLTLYNGILPNTPTEAYIYDTYTIINTVCYRNTTILYYLNGVNRYSHNYVEICDTVGTNLTEKTTICYSAWFPNTFGNYPCVGNAQVSQAFMALAILSVVCFGTGTCCMMLCCPTEVHSASASTNQDLEIQQPPKEYAIPVHAIEVETANKQATMLGINNDGKNETIIILNP